MTENILTPIQNFFLGFFPAGWIQHLTPEWIARQLFFLGVILVVFFATRLVFRRVIHKWIRKKVARSKTNWDDILYHHKVFHALTSLVPVFIAYYLIQQLFTYFWPFISRLLIIYITFHMVYLFDCILNAVNAIYESYQVAKRKPIKGYLQLFKIFIYILGVIVSLSVIVGQSPLALLSGLGALTAVLLLIFKDTILSFVASIQVAGNDLVRMGDWIEMSQYGADGEVVEIALHTIRVQNWDKTYTTIPMHKIMEAPFKNWRGMSLAGGRRIKRSISIDIQSVHFVTGEDVNRFLELELLEPYRDNLEVEIRQLTNGHNIAQGQPTNLGVFRLYIEQLIAAHHRLHNDMTNLVRTLPPTFEGIPLEIYTFSKDTQWAVYEKHQSALIEHLIATLPVFGLKVAQSPTGEDIRSLSCH